MYLIIDIMRLSKGLQGNQKNGFIIANWLVQWRCMICILMNHMSSLSCIILFLTLSKNVWRFSPESKR